VKCDEGRYCEDGKCVGDPCVNIVCPEGNVCKEGQCYGGTTPPPKNPNWSEFQPEGGNPEGSNPDGGNLDIATENTANPNDGEGNQKETTVVIESNNAQPERYGVGGCGCQGTSPLDSAPLWFGMILVLLFVTRRRKIA
jgi:MYXO-CTERM domain-containing protein